MHSNKPAHSPFPPLQLHSRHLAAIALLSFGAAAAQAQTNSGDLPGKGVSVQPLKGTVD